jgi:hypothetical protein
MDRRLVLKVFDRESQGRYWCVITIARECLKCDHSVMKNASGDYGSMHSNNNNDDALIANN